MSEKIPLTQALYDKYKAELEHYINVELPKNSEDIAAAIAQGDLSENAEYEYAKDEQFRINKEISRLKHILQNAEIIQQNVNTDFAEIGHTVTVVSMDDDSKLKFTLIGQWDENPENVPVDSPFGKALLGKAVGDLFIVDAPKGELKYKLINIEAN